MKYNEHASVKDLWLQFALEVLRQKGKVYAIGLLVGILAKHTYGDYEMRRELLHRLDKL